MTNSKVLLLTACAGLTLLASPAAAQATRTWVSGLGDDVNPCSRTAPCKTFAGAISKTAAGGEISVLDPGGYGTVTITKSISIVADGSGEAGVLNSGTSGVIVNGAGVVVTLKGLYIHGGGNGIGGVRVLNAAVVNIENCVIERNNGGAPSDGWGVRFIPSAGAAELNVSDTTIQHNGVGTSGGAILIAPTGGAAARATITRVQALNNVNGIRTDGAGGAATTTIVATTSANNEYNGFIANGGAGARVLVTDSTSSNNLVQGVRAANGASITIASSTISNNGVAIGAESGGQVFSDGRNVFHNNAVDNISPTIVSPR